MPWRCLRQACRLPTTHQRPCQSMVGIGQTSGLAVTFGYAWAVRDAGEEIVTFFEGRTQILCSFVRPRSDATSRWSTIPFQISHRLRSRPEVRLSRSPPTSVPPRPVFSPSRGLRSRSPPTPGGHAGVRSNLSASGEERGAEEQDRAHDRPSESQKDGALSHPLYYDVKRQEDVSCLYPCRTCPAAPSYLGDCSELFRNRSLAIALLVYLIPGYPGRAAPPGSTCERAFGTLPSPEDQTPTLEDDACPVG